MKFSTRTKIVTTSIVLPVLFIILSLFELAIPFYQDYREWLIPLILGFLEMAFIFWVVNFSLKGERMFTVTTFPALSVGIFVAFLTAVIRTSGNDVDRISTLIFSSFILGLVTYILTSNINILNLASLRPIPLGQAGRAAHYVLTLVFSYFAFVLLVSMNIPFVLKPFLVFGFVFTYTFVALWTISLAYSHRFISSLGIAFTMVFAYMALAIWPIESFYYALFMVLTYYMLLGVALEIREIISNWLWYEYIGIFLVMALILLATANWGVNGVIFLG